VAAISAGLGAVAIDARHLGGDLDRRHYHKHSGRIGDSPVIAPWCYANKSPSQQQTGRRSRRPSQPVRIFVRTVVPRTYLRHLSSYPRRIYTSGSPASAMLAAVIREKLPSLGGRVGIGRDRHLGNVAAALSKQSTPKGCIRGWARGSENGAHHRGSN